MRRTARSHVVLGMDFEKTERLSSFNDVGEVLGLKLAPTDTGSVDACICSPHRSIWNTEARDRFARASFSMARSGLRHERAGPLGRGNLCAGALGDVFPGVALVVDPRGPGTGRACAGRAIIVLLERDAVTTYPCPPALASVRFRDPSIGHLQASRPRRAQLQTIRRERRQ